MSEFAVDKLTENIIDAGDRVDWLGFRREILYMVDTNGIQIFKHGWLWRAWYDICSLT